MFVVGTAVGMTAAIAYHRVTGNLERWPLIVGYCAVVVFYVSLLVTALTRLD